jgi:hypothetical protein
METVLAFIGCTFLLLGPRFMIGSINHDMVLLGDPFASLALTYFWIVLKR